MTKSVDCTNRDSFESTFINSWEDWDELHPGVFYFYQCKLKPNFAAVMGCHPKSKFDVLVDLGTCTVELYDGEGSPIESCKKRFKLVFEEEIECPTCL